MLLRNFQEMKKNHHTSATCYVADTLRRALLKDRGNATQREGCCGRALEGEGWAEGEAEWAAQRAGPRGPVPREGASWVGRKGAVPFAKEMVRTCRRAY